jgi:hypothetical protein
MNKNKSFVIAEVKIGQTPITQLLVPALPSFEPTAFA